MDASEQVVDSQTFSAENQYGQPVGFQSTDYAQLSGSLRSARKVLSTVVEYASIESLLDVGCGNGSWLSAAANMGIRNVVGVEGGDISEQEFLGREEDLVRMDVSIPFSLNRKFDLVISLEVAEHLEEIASVEFVRNLCRHGDLVLFSAAIPGQQGTNHVNCQWPEYWASKFEEEGFECFDFLRTILWKDREIEVWYRQNLLVFATGAARDQFLDRGLQPCVPQSLVHPDLWEWSISRQEGTAGS